MRIQDYVIHASKEAAEEFFHYADATPPDKLDWKPLDTGRSILGLAREIAVTPTWAWRALTGAAWSEEQETQDREEMSGWLTLDHCKAAQKERLNQWAEVVAAMPDEQLSQTKWLPFNGGRDHTYLELLGYVRWNSTYHLGQVAYIQRLYGDHKDY